MMEHDSEMAKNASGKEECHSLTLAHPAPRPSVTFSESENLIRERETEPTSFPQRRRTGRRTRRRRSQVAGPSVKENVPKSVAKHMADFQSRLTPASLLEIADRVIHNDVTEMGIERHIGGVPNNGKPSLFPLSYCPKCIERISSYFKDTDMSQRILKEYKEEQTDKEEEMGTKVLFEDTRRLALKLLDALNLRCYDHVSVEVNSKLAMERGGRLYGIPLTLASLIDSEREFECNTDRLYDKLAGGDNVAASFSTGTVMSFESSPLSFVSDNISRTHMQCVEDNVDYGSIRLSCKCMKSDEWLTTRTRDMMRLSASSKDCNVTSDKTGTDVVDTAPDRDAIGVATSGDSERDGTADCSSDTNSRYDSPIGAGTGADIEKGCAKDGSVTDAEHGKTNNNRAADDSDMGGTDIADTAIGSDDIDDSGSDDYHSTGHVSCDSERDGTADCSSDTNSRYDSPIGVGTGADIEKGCAKDGSVTDAEHGITNNNRAAGDSDMGGTDIADTTIGSDDIDDSGSDDYHINGHVSCDSDRDISDEDSISVCDGSHIDSVCDGSHIDSDDLGGSTEGDEASALFLHAIVRDESPIGVGKGADIERGGTKGDSVTDAEDGSPNDSRSGSDSDMGGTDIDAVAVVAKGIDDTIVHVSGVSDRDSDGSDDLGGSAEGDEDSILFLPATGGDRLTIDKLVPPDDITFRPKRSLPVVSAPEEFDNDEWLDLRASSLCLSLCRHSADCIINETNRRKIINSVLLVRLPPTDENQKIGIASPSTAGEEVYGVVASPDNPIMFSLGSTTYEATNGHIYHPWGDDELSLPSSDYKNDCCSKKRSDRHIFLQQPTTKVYTVIHTVAAPFFKSGPISNIDYSNDYGSYKTFRVLLPGDFTGRYNDKSLDWRSHLYSNMTMTLARRECAGPRKREDDVLPGRISDNRFGLYNDGGILEITAVSDDSGDLSGNYLRAIREDRGKEDISAHLACINVWDAETILNTLAGKLQDILNGPLREAVVELERDRQMSLAMENPTTHEIQQLTSEEKLHYGKLRLCSQNYNTWRRGLRTLQLDIATSKRQIEENLKIPYLLFHHSKITNGI